MDVPFTFLKGNHYLAFFLNKEEYADKQFVGEKF